MATFRFRIAFSAVAAALIAEYSAHAQTATSLPPVSVTGRAAPDISGWGDMPASSLPLQTSTLREDQRRDRGMTRLSDVTRMDPGVSDAYNAEGYWDFLTVRGFVIDNRNNYRRDGLPINAQTSIPLDNKDRVEVLKGTSGLQAGTSAPGGLVNFVVKRPTETPLRDIRLEWRERNSVLGAVDLSQRFGETHAFGVRLNAAAEHLDPLLRASRGDRHLAAIAGDWRVSRDTLIEAEFETSHRSQPSQAAFGLWGDAMPSPADPRLNLNNQPWSLPVAMNAGTGSLRATQTLTPGWRATLHAASQRLSSDDRMAYASGCSAANTYVRFCADGSYDLYDFRSEGERRRTDAIEAALQGRLKSGALTHAISVGALRTHARARMRPQAYNLVGTGNSTGTAVTPADPSLTDEGTNRNERSSELFVRDAVGLASDVTVWLGVRHTRLHRDSIRTDGTQATSYAQTLTSPSIAISHAFAQRHSVYASWGRGAETEVAPSRPRYANAGQALPALMSRQIEAGWRYADNGMRSGVALFDITRPAFRDIGTDCGTDDTPGSCTHSIDGRAHHRGIEAELEWKLGAWTLQGGFQALRARREGSNDAMLNGKRPTNVPQLALKGEARWRVAAMPGLQLQVGGSAQSDRMVFEDNSVRIPGYGLIDAGARFDQQLSTASLTWRAGIDNLLDRRAWRESPFQFGHGYLYPLAPRTLRVSVEVAL